MLDAFSCDVAILAIRVNAWLNGKGLHYIGAGLSWYDGYVVFVGVIKKFLSLLGWDIDTVHFLIGIDIFAFFVGFLFLMNFVAKRVSVATTLLVCLVFLSTPGVLPVATLGHGHSIVFMLVSLYIWLADRIRIDEKGNYVVKQFVLLVSTVLLISIFRVQDALFGLFSLMWIFLYKVGGFHWRKSRLFMYFSVIFLVGLGLFMAACYTTSFDIRKLANILHLFYPKLFFIYISCFIYGMGLLSLAIFFPKRNLAYWLAGITFVLLVMASVATYHLNFEFRFIFPALAFWTVAFSFIADDMIKSSSRKLKWVFIAITVGLSLLMGGQVEKFMIHRLLRLNEKFVVMLEKQVSPDIVIAQDLSPLFLYYTKVKVLNPPVFPNLDQAQAFWQKILNLLAEGKKIVLLSSALNYDLTSVLKKTLPKTIFLNNVYGSYLLDWHGCHGIIPVLYWDIGYLLVKKEEPLFGYKFYDTTPCSSCSKN